LRHGRAACRIVLPPVARVETPIDAEATTPRPFVASGAVSCPGATLAENFGKLCLIPRLLKRDQSLFDNVPSCLARTLQAAHDIPHFGFEIKADGDVARGRTASAGARTAVAEFRLFHKSRLPDEILISIPLLLGLVLIYEPRFKCPLTH
jgi:hypothetical protein